MKNLRHFLGGNHDILHLDNIIKTIQRNLLLQFKH